jgi:hypothetical protein
MTQTQTARPEDLLVSLTLHNFPAGMLKEFALRIVKPYFHANLNEAVRCLMEKAVQEEIILEQALITDKNKSARSRDLDPSP